MPESKIIKALKRDIAKYQKNLIAKVKSKGIYENFGDVEHRKLLDRFQYVQGTSYDDRQKINALINEFFEWSSYYQGWKMSAIEIIKSEIENAERILNNIQNNETYNIHHFTVQAAVLSKLKEVLEKIEKN